MNQRQKSDHAGVSLVLLFLIRKLQDLNSSYSKVFEVLLFLDSYTRFSVPKTIKSEKFGKMQAVLTAYLIRSIAGSYSFSIYVKIIKPKSEIVSCRRAFGPSFPNSKIRRLYQLLPEIIWNITFRRYLHQIIRFKKKKIWKIWQNASSFNYLIQ